MSTIELCQTCLRPASLRKAAEIDIQSRQAEADRLNAFVASMEAAVCHAVGVDPVAVRLATLEAENKGLIARVAELEERCKRLEEVGDMIVAEYMVVEPEKSAWQQAKEAKP